MEIRWSVRRVVGAVLVVVGLSMAFSQVFRMNAIWQLVAGGIVLAMLGALMALEEEEEVA